MKKKYISNIIWFTGLSGAGKTTIANELTKKLKNNRHKVKQIDGDIFRKKTNNLNNFSKKNIIKNNNLIINHIKKFYKNYDYSIISVISPLRQTRQRAKKIFGKNYFEVFVNCSIKELFNRDTKNLYIDAKNGKIKNLIGYNSKIKYEKSKYKKIIVHTHRTTLNKSLTKILKSLN